MPRKLIPCGLHFCLVPLANSATLALIDATYADIVSKFNWCHSSNGYALTATPKHWFGKNRLMYLHHLVAGYPLGGLQVDHINRDKYDCRAMNLRVVSRSVNLHNTGRRSTNTSGYKGVCRCGNKWKAYAAVDGRQHYFGLFDTARAAAAARDAAVESLQQEAA